MASPRPPYTYADPGPSSGYYGQPPHQQVYAYGRPYSPYNHPDMYGHQHQHQHHIPSPQPYPHFHPSQNSQSYPSPHFSPAYPYPPPPPWAAHTHNQSQNSPLPKQLSVPPTFTPGTSTLHTPPKGASPAAAVPQTSELTQRSSPVIPPSTTDSEPQTPTQVDPEPAAQQQEAEGEPESPASSADEESSTSTAPSHARTTSVQSASGSMLTWAVWSRRPRNPAAAPGLIISPRAHPPQDVIEQALQISTPPASPILAPVRQRVTVESSGSVPEAEAERHELRELERERERGTSVSRTDTNTVTNTNTPITIPTSPLTSNTSISPSSPKIAPQASASSTPLSETKESTEQTVAATATVPAPTPVKKSWASLLRTSPSASSSPALPGHSKLPTSAVVGFSIPAEQSPAPSPPPVIPTNKAALTTLLSHPVSYSDKRIEKVKPRGLVNQGNMCFANSVLQVLVYCPPFHGLFYQLGKVMAEQLASSPSSNPTPSQSASVPSSSMRGEGKRKADWDAPLVQATVEFLEEFVPEVPKETKRVNGKGKEKAEDCGDWEAEWETTSFLPTNVYDAMKEKKRFDTMRGGQQEDAEEFFGFYLDTLEEELLKLAGPSPSAAAKVHEEEKEEQPEGNGWMEVGKRNRTVITRTLKNTESPITKMFGGKFRSTLKAPGQKDSAIVEDWRSLRLDIQPDHIQTVQDALLYISHAQTVSLTHPSRPGITVEGSQQVLIESLPPILVLHMKRFHYDVNVRGVVKMSKYVGFGPELDIRSELMTPAARRPTPTKYKLFGALYHHGISAEGGHYTLDILHPHRNGKGREGWVRHDDEVVSDVRPDDVFGGNAGDETRCAYLLFYRRVSSSAAEAVGGKGGAAVVGK